MITGFCHNGREPGQALRADRPNAGGCFASCGRGCWWRALTGWSLMGRPRSATRRNAPKTPGCREPLAGVANVPAESAPTCQLFPCRTDICRRCKLLVADWRKARSAIMRASNVPRTCHPARSWLCVSLGGRLVALVGASFAGLVVCSLGSSDC